MIKEELIKVVEDIKKGEELNIPSFPPPLWEWEEIPSKDRNS